MEGFKENIYIYRKEKTIFIRDSGRPSCVPNSPIVMTQIYQAKQEALQKLGDKNDYIH